MQGLPAQPCAPSIMHFGHNRDTKPCRFYKFSPWYNLKNDGKKKPSEKLVKLGCKAMCFCDLKRNRERYSAESASGTRSYFPKFPQFFTVVQFEKRWQENAEQKTS